MAYSTDQDAEILAIARNLRGKVQDIDNLAERHIAAGSSVDTFRAAALAKLPEIRPMTKPLLSDVPVREWSKYSITRAIKQVAEGGLSGIEKEMSDETTRQIGHAASGFWLPTPGRIRPTLS